jgi:hypothetical protein
MLVLPIMALACAPSNRENTASCGFAAMAGATMVLEQLRGSGRFLDAAPAGLAGTVPARVVGYGTTAALAAESEEGILVAYDGPGFPSLPGWGLALVEDSLDTFKGVLIYETEPPFGAPLLGGVTSGSYTVPLHAARVSWAAVSDPRCPLFGSIDTAAG